MSGALCVKHHVRGMVNEKEETPPAWKIGGGSEEIVRISATEKSFSGFFFLLKLENESLPLSGGETNSLLSEISPIKPSEEGNAQRSGSSGATKGPE